MTAGTARTASTAGTTSATSSRTARTLVLGGRPLPVVGTARLYVCGVTPYDVTHLGHAATFVWVDLVDRVLRRLGTPTEVTRNVTDVDDVLFDAAARAGAYYDRFAAVQQFHFEHDMAVLGVRTPTHQPRAHQFVPQVVQLAQVLLDAGAAYVADGSVYLDAGPVLAASGLPREEAVALLGAHGGRLEDPAKRDPADQAVWVRSTGDEPAWPSPWGPGRPGWHAECTAMALSLYGSSLDLHAGGADLRFPHHAFETAQAEAATGVRPFARAWMHVGTVQRDGDKMAKSTGNLLFVKDLVEHWGVPALRLTLLDRPYAAAWDVDDTVLAAGAARAEALHAAAGRPGGSEAATGAVLDRLCDDLDVVGALAIALAEGGSAARDLAALLLT